MSKETNSESETYSVIFKALKHSIRRRILRMLIEKPTSFSDILRVLQIDSGRLTYHLDNLSELVSKNEHGEYQLSVFGRAAAKLFSDVEGLEEARSPSFFSWRQMSKVKAITLIVIILVGLGSTVYLSSLMSRQEERLTVPEYEPYTSYWFDSPNFMIYNRFFTVEVLDVPDPTQSASSGKSLWTHSFQKEYNSTVYFHVLVYGEDISDSPGFSRTFEVSVEPREGGYRRDLRAMPTTKETSYWEDVVRLDGDGPCTVEVRVRGDFVKGQRNTMRLYIQVDRMIVIESVSFSVNQTKIRLGGAVEVRGQVYPNPYLNGRRLEVVVEGSRGGQGWDSIAGRDKGIPINPDGSFSYVWKPQKNGVYELRASFSSGELIPPTYGHSTGSPYPPFIIYSNAAVLEVEGKTGDVDYGFAYRSLLSI